ncbi:MAG: hypothetical protein AAB449_02065 [Patescibacteria group bacterium]
MNKEKRNDRIAHGGGRWHASRLKPVVKKLGVKNKKKKPARSKK